MQQIETLMQKVHANQVWVEEIQPLSDRDTSWNQDHTIDSQIRSVAENQSNPSWLNDTEAISMGTSNQTFGQFIDAVDRLSQANRDHDTQTTRQGNAHALLFSQPGTFPSHRVAGCWRYRDPLEGFLSSCFTLSFLFRLSISVEQRCTDFHLFGGALRIVHREKAFPIEDTHMEKGTYEPAPAIT